MPQRSGLLFSLCCLLLIAASSEKPNQTMGYWTPVVASVADTVKLHCIPELDTEPKVVRWYRKVHNRYYFDDKRWKKNATERSLTITDLKVEDRGLYMCSVLSRSGKETHAFRLNITQQTKPHFIDNLGTKIHMVVQAGETAKMQCRQNDGTNMTWKKLGENYPLCSQNCPLDQHYRISEDGALLTFNSADPSDSGTYQCAISDGVSTSERNFHLTVRNILTTLPPLLTSTPVTQSKFVKVSHGVSALRRKFSMPVRNKTTTPLPRLISTPVTQNKGEKTIADPDAPILLADEEAFLSERDTVKLFLYIIIGVLLIAIFASLIYICCADRNCPVAQYVRRRRKKLTIRRSAASFGDQIVPDGIQMLLSGVELQMNEYVPEPQRERPTGRVWPCQPS